MWPYGIVTSGSTSAFIQLKTDSSNGIADEQRFSMRRTRIWRLPLTPDPRLTESDLQQIADFAAGSHRG
jgi:hypothetical protein